MGPPDEGSIRQPIAPWVHFHWSSVNNLFRLNVNVLQIMCFTCTTCFPDKTIIYNYLLLKEVYFKDNNLLLKEVYFKDNNLLLKEVYFKDNNLLLKEVYFKDNNLLLKEIYFKTIILSGMMHIKEPLLLIGKHSSCGGSEFPLSLSEWSLTICLTPYNRK